MKIALVYDCIYPWTVGGAERWYRNLADELVEAGHEVTYLTRLQWPRDDPPSIPGVDVIAVSGADDLYTEGGRRRALPPLRFGFGVLRHLLRHRSSYDALHLCAFPFFPLLAARAALAGRPTVIGVDWFEVWTRSYWTSYLGRASGLVGYAVQRACVRLTPRAFVFSRLHARRLRDEGLRAEPIRLAGLYAGPVAPSRDGDAADPLVVFAGRQIPEKRAELIPPAVAIARRSLPELRGLILGDGPGRARILRAIAASRTAGVVEAPGFVAAAEVDAALRRAMCLLLPSAREGYGLVVIEAAAGATPTVTVAGPDNAATELIEDDVNGYVVPSADPAAIAAAILRVHGEGRALRDRTAAWFIGHAPRLTARASAREVAATYRRAAGLQPRQPGR